MSRFKVPLGLLFWAVLISGSCIAASAGPNFLEDNPQRPADSKLLKATSGVFVRYQLIATDRLLSPRVTILDDVTGTDRTFSLSFKTEVNGKRLACGSDAANALSWVAAHAVARHHLCAHLPIDVSAGRTRITVLYWDHRDLKPANALIDYDTEPASDAIWISK